MESRMMRRKLAIVATAALFARNPYAVRAQQAASQSAPATPAAPAIRATTELVLVNVVARDKKGNLVRDLKQQDFTVLEDGQKQQVASFDFENVDEMALAGQTTPMVTGSAGPETVSAKPAVPVMEARGRRLILLFFDFSAMDPEQIDRAVDAAKGYVNNKMQPADMIAIVS